MDHSSPDPLAAALIAECRHRIVGESRPRVLACLAKLNDEQIWRRPNERSNSAGNLVLHLCGNLRQWVVHGLGGAADIRERDAEFAQRGPIPSTELAERFSRTMDEVDRVLDRLDSADLLTPRRVQGFDETGVSVLVHATEHLSYHTGQITYITKAATDEDIGFYRGIELNRTG